MLMASWQVNVKIPIAGPYQSTPLTIGGLTLQKVSSEELWYIILVVALQTVEKRVELLGFDTLWRPRDVNGDCVVWENALF